MAYNTSSQILIGSKVASNSASITFTSNIAIYNTILITFSNVTPGTTATNLLLQISTNGGGAWQNSNYTLGQNNALYNSATYSNTNATTGFFLAGTLDTTAGDFASGIYWLNDINSGAHINGMGQNLVYASGNYSGITTGSNTVSTGTNALRFIMSSGNIATGTFTLYGMVV